MNTEYYESTLGVKVDVKHQNDFRLLLQCLKQLGYLNKTKPIIKLEFKKEQNSILASLNTPTFRNYGHELLFVFNCNDGSLSNLISHGDNHLIHQIAKARWGNDIDNYLNNIHNIVGNTGSYYENVVPLSDAIILLGETQKIIEDEIIKQGHKINNKHIAQLLQISKLKHEYDLVGDITDWIPYVYAGIDIDLLSVFLNKSNNRDYETTGKILFDIRSMFDEIIRQGYTIKEEYIHTLIDLNESSDQAYLKDRPAGKMSDWIPYVYAGIEKDILLGIFDIRNNPDYDKTGKLFISIDDYKSKFANMHPSFVKLLLQPN